MIAGTDLTGGGTAGTVTLNLNTALVPTLAAANSFTNSQSVTGNVTATGTVQGGVVNATTGFDIGGAPLLAAFNASNFSAGLQALPLTATGTNNTATGFQALSENTIGIENTVNGSQTLGNNTQGNGNTAIGFSAMLYNATGNTNTAIGQEALHYNQQGNNNTAIGFDALLYDTTGSSNIAVGTFAGNNVALSNNIDIGNEGTATDNGIIRIGTVGTQTSAYIAGIAGVTLPTTGEPLVCIDPPTGQLGTVNCASNGAAVAQQKANDRQRREIQTLTQQVSDLQQRLSRLESLIASK